MLLFSSRDADGNPDTWGPSLWAILHRLAERVGRGDPSSNRDHAWHIEFLVHHLATVLPCETCQAHCRAYLKTHPFSCGDRVNEDLSLYVRTWFFDFHNAVRASKSQPIEVAGVESLAAMYSSSIQECDMNAFVAHVAYGVRIRIVKTDNWKRWITILKRFRLMLSL